MTEYSLNQNLAEMAQEIRGKPDRFLRVSIQLKEGFRAFEFSGEKTELIDGILKGASEGYIKVVTQSIGTYTEDN